MRLKCQTRKTDDTREPVRDPRDPAVLLVALGEHISQRERCHCMARRKTLALEHPGLEPGVGVAVIPHVTWPDPAVDHLHRESHDLCICHGLSCQKRRLLSV